MAPKTRVKRKAMTAALFSTSSWKKRRISLQSVTFLPASNETMPRVTVSPGAEEPAVLEGTSVTGPNTGQEGQSDVAGPSSGSEGTSDASAGSMKMGIEGLRSRISEETGSVLEDISGTGGEETTAQTTVRSTQRTLQEIRKDFAEDWLETLGKDEIISIAHARIGMNE